jgi:peptidyl-prolyl cis-trans isomerase D
VIPELDLKSPEASATAKQISADIGQDLMTEYVGKVQADIGVSINQTNVDRIVGGSSAL